MRCPKCSRKDLGPIDVQGIEVDQCPECRGLWFDEYELEDLLELDFGDVEALMNDGAQAAEEESDAAAKCPRDAVDLARKWSSGRRKLQIDVCPKCSGVWLDGGEFRRFRQGE